MRKVISALLVASVLLLCAAPIFAFAEDAPFTINSSLSYDYIYNYSCDIQIIASDGVKTYAYMYHVPSDIQFRYWHCYESPNTPGQSRLICIFYNNNVTYPVQLTVDIVDLVSGNTSVYTVNISSGQIEIGPTGHFFDSTKTVYFYSPTGQTAVYSNSKPMSLSNAFVVFARSSTDFINVPFTKPVYDPYHSYFLDSDHFYMIVSNHGLVANNILGFSTYVQDSDEIQIYSSTDGSCIYESVIPQVEQYGANQFKFVFKTYSHGADYDFVYYVSTFDINTGQLINCTTVNVPANSTKEYTFRVNHPENGVWHNNIAYSNRVYNTPMIMVRWSDTIDYTSQLNSVSSLLTSLYNDTELINTAVQSINNYVTSIYDDTWTIRRLINNIDSKVYLIWDNLIPYLDWMQGTFYNTITGKWNITNNLLVSIFNLLNQTDETMTIEDDTSGVAAMESAKNDLVVTNSAGQTVDAGDAAADGLSEAAVQIGEIAQPVSTINSLMQNIVFDKPKLLLPVIVALGLGLMVTILGKNKSD